MKIQYENTLCHRRLKLILRQNTVNASKRGYFEYLITTLSQRHLDRKNIFGNKILATKI